LSHFFLLSLAQGASRCNIAAELNDLMLQATARNSVFSGGCPGLGSNLVPRTSTYLGTNTALERRCACPQRGLCVPSLVRVRTYRFAITDLGQRFLDLALERIWWVVYDERAFPETTSVAWLRQRYVAQKKPFIWMGRVSETLQHFRTSSSNPSSPSRKQNLKWKTLKWSYDPKCPGRNFGGV